MRGKTGEEEKRTQIVFNMSCVLFSSPVCSQLRIGPGLQQFAVALFPFLFVRKDKKKVAINNERGVICPKEESDLPIAQQSRPHNSIERANSSIGDGPHR
jgi:hypothetical protein